MEDNLFDIEAARELPGVPDKERPLGVVPNERSMFQLRLKVLNQWERKPLDLFKSRPFRDILFVQKINHSSIMTRFLHSSLLAGNTSNTSLFRSRCYLKYFIHLPGILFHK